MLTRIGCNTSKYASRESKRKYNRRIIEVACFYPASTVAFALVVGCALIYALTYAPDRFAVAVIAVFFAVAAFVELRLLPSSDELISRWAMEDGV
jgi:hypothetical protein